MADALAIAKRTGALIVAPYEVSEWLAKQGAPKTHPVNPGGTRNLDVCRAKFVNAIHSSSLPDGTYGGNPGGFVIESDEGNFYYAGDTALTLDMKLIGESTKLNWAALPVGDNFTMGAADAVRAAEFVNCNEVLGVHFDTFPPIKIDHRAAVEIFAAKGKKLHLLKPGETHDF
jgi:L-ascorbate metabolism protein UlaG (beta-lactamase superfamily)